MRYRARFRIRGAANSITGHPEVGWRDLQVKMRGVTKNPKKVLVKFGAGGPPEQASAGPKWALGTVRPSQTLPNPQHTHTTYRRPPQTKKNGPKLFSLTVGLSGRKSR